jgi:hypothetical protein
MIHNKLPTRWLDWIAEYKLMSRFPRLSTCRDVDGMIYEAIIFQICASTI